MKANLIREKSYASLEILIVTCVLIGSTGAWAACTAAEEKQIGELRSSWLANWNSKQVDNVVNLYTAKATYMPPDGTRITGQSEIRAFL